MRRGNAKTPQETRETTRESRALKPFACVACYGLAAAALAVGLYHAPAPDWAAVVLITALACVGAYLAVGGRFKLSVGKEGVSASIEEHVPKPILEGADVFTAEGTSGVDLAEEDIAVFENGFPGLGGVEEAAEPANIAAQMALPAASPAGGPPRAIPAYCTDFYLTHEVWPVPGGPGPKQWYAVRIALEADCEELMDTCERVTYRLHPTFPKPVVATKARDKEFELWIRCWGEFTVTARVDRQDGPPVVLTRYLDLPGRPED